MEEQKGRYVRENGIGKLTAEEAKACAAYAADYADYLGIANIELCRFLEQRISLNGIRQSTPDAENDRRLIGVLNPCILAKLRQNIRKQGDCIALRQQSLMRIAQIKQGIHHFPPACRSIQRNSGFEKQLMNFRQSIRLIKPGMSFVRKFVIGKADGSADNAGHAVGRR